MRRPHGSATVGHRGTWSFALRVLACLITAELGAAMGPLLAQGSWQPAEPLLTPRRLLAAAAHGGKIYTFGGCGSPCFDPPLHTSTLEERKVEIYDPVTKDWITKEPMPAIVFGAAAAAPGDGTIYLVGGFVTGGDTWAYDPERDAWTPRARMPTPRRGLAAVALDGKVWAIGGSDGRTASTALEVYEPTTNTWSRKRPMTTPRVFLAAAAVGGKIYAIGGSQDGRGTSATAVVEVYDPDANRWTSVRSLPKALQVSAAAVVDGRIYVAGGFIPGQGSQKSTFVYDPASDVWTELDALLNVARDQAPAVALGRSVHLLGGSSACHCQALAAHEVLTPPGVPETDLTIDVDDHLNLVCPNQRVAYTITVTNKGTVAVNGAVVTTSTTPALEGTTWTCVPEGGARCTTGPRPGAVQDQVDLPVASKVVYTLTGTVPLTARGSFVARATVTLPPSLERHDEETVRIARGRLKVEKTATPDPVAPGGILLYEITVENTCHTALSVTVEDRLSDTGLDDIRWCQGAGCSPSETGDIDDTTTLPARGTVVYRASGTVPCDCGEARIIRNRACAVAPGQNQVCAETATSLPETPTEDLAVTVTGPDDAEGCEQPYTIAVSNRAGPCPARDVALTVTPPAGFVLASLSSPCAGGSPCALGDIAKDAEVRVTATLAPVAAALCPLASVPLTASATSRCDAASDDASTERVLCDLAITKADGLATVGVGAPLPYTIGVTNNGCTTAEARVTDLFPDVIEPVMWCQEGVDCPPTTLGDLTAKLVLPPGRSATFRTAATAPAFPTTVCNTATVEPVGGLADEATPADNTATDCTDVVIFPEPVPHDQVPTLSEVGLALLALALAALAVWRLRAG